MREVEGGRVKGLMKEMVVDEGIEEDKRREICMEIDFNVKGMGEVEEVSG